jgi:protein-S-isoprenylcysteine O-methyltransferase Ste14
MAGPNELDARRRPAPRLITRQLLVFTAVVAAAALLPLALDPAREWLRPALWLAVVLFYRWIEQSVFRASPVVGVRAGEWLFLPIYLGVTGSILLPAVEFFFFPRPIAWPVVGTGLALALCGTIIRYTAIDALGEQLSTHVEVRPNHRLVDSGPFRYVRHPGTTGAMILFVGAALVLQAYFSLLYIVGFLGTLLVIRMFIEERHSAAHMPGYREYMGRTKRLIPFLF